MRTLTQFLAVAAATCAIAVGGIATAYAAQDSAPPTRPSSESGSSAPMSLVEDYSYPGASHILTEDGVKLISGDGHIIYADCDTPPSDGIDVITVRTVDGLGMDHDGLACFTVLGDHGSLTMKIPTVYEIDGDGAQPDAGHGVRADLITPSGKHTTVDVDPHGSTPVGIGAGGTEPTTLLQLTASS